MEEVIKQLNRLNYFVFRRMAKMKGYNYYDRRQSISIDVFERNFSNRVVNRRKIIKRRIILSLLTIVLLTTIVLYFLFKLEFLKLLNINEFINLAVLTKLIIN